MELKQEIRTILRDHGCGYTDFNNRKEVKKEMATRRILFDVKKVGWVCKLMKRRNKRESQAQIKHRSTEGGNCC